MTKNKIFQIYDTMCLWISKDFIVTSIHFFCSIQDRNPVYVLMHYTVLCVVLHLLDTWKRLIE